MVKRKVPNVVRGGIAIPLENKTNYYYMSGRKHKDGGIDIGKNPRTGLEVEDGEVMHVSDNEIKVFSSVPFLNGESPAQKVMGGENPTTVFKQQEQFKDRNKINDDGTKKKAMGGLSRSKDYGSKSKPYPSVDKKDFAGGHRSYPIPTKADAVDALRLAGLHGRSDVKTKVYSKYPELRKKAKAGGLYSVTVNGETKLKMFPSINKKTLSDINDRDKFILGGDDEYLRIGDTKYNKGSIIDYNGDKIAVIGKNTGISIDGITSASDKQDNKHDNLSSKTPSNISPYLYFNKDLFNAPSFKPKSIRNNNEKPISSKKTPNNNLSLTNAPTNSLNKKTPSNNEKLRNIVPIRINPPRDINSVENFSKPISQSPINRIPLLPIEYTDIDRDVLKPITIENKYQNNKISNDFISDGIGLISNITGAALSHTINKKMLNKLKYTSEPIARTAAKLKTRININPQLDKMRESLADYEMDIDNNTASSRVALARKQRARLANMLQTNELYGTKENQETELINKDKINQQAVAAENIKDYNDWSEKKASFDNTVREKKAENDVALIETLNQGVQDVIGRREKRSSDRQTRLAMAAGYPNVNPRILRDLGVKGITDADIKRWEEAFGKKKKKDNN